ncbi:MAG: hypothetical protein N3A38_06985 [Planctomycetota bacterium]|nr:hypothetical protein [Planctomycetota bacterium]
MNRERMFRESVAAVALAASSAAFAVPAAADVQVNDRTDRIRLADGEEIECIILVATPRALVVVEKAASRQRTIGRDEIVSIERGRLEGRINGYMTDTVGCRKEIRGEGFRREEKPAMEAKTGPEAGGEPEARHQPRHPPDKSAMRKAMDLMASYERHYPAMARAIAAFVGIERFAGMIAGAGEDPSAVERYRDIAARLAAGDRMSDAKPPPGPRKPRRAAAPGGAGAGTGRPPGEPEHPPAAAGPVGRPEPPAGGAAQPAGKSGPAPFLEVRPEPK